MQALDLGALSTAEPLQLLGSFQGGGHMAQELAVNDLEPPAFSMCVKSGLGSNRYAQADTDGDKACF